MWQILGIMAVSGVIAIIEIPGLVKKKANKDVMVVTGLLLIGSVLSIMESLQIHIFNPLNGIKAILQPISILIFNLLK